MNNIEVKVLNPEAIIAAQDMMVAMARLTQGGQNINNMEDFMALLSKPYKAETADAMGSLPHDTIKRFGTINVAVVGASRRFLAQITRHQVGVTFMSGSLHYGDYSGKAKFVVPYDIIKADVERRGNAEYVESFNTNAYLSTCEDAAGCYNSAVEQGINIDNAGYMMPQGMRNVLLISANANAWNTMISTRICRRNAEEIRYVMLRILEEFQKTKSSMFDKAYPKCILNYSCPEGKMQAPMCVHIGKPGKSAAYILDSEYPLLRGQQDE